MEKFSQKLIEDFRTYWLLRWEERISIETAEAYLGALAELYLCMSKINEREFSRD
jgi:hypothetical protein